MAERLVKLVQELHLKTARDRLKLCLVEGHRSVLDVLQQGITPIHLVVTSAAINSHTLGDRLRNAMQTIDSQSMSIHEISSREFQKISTTTHPQASLLS